MPQNDIPRPAGELDHANPDAADLCFRLHQLLKTTLAVRRSPDLPKPCVFFGQQVPDCT